jgi:hypothetical protein
MRERMRNPITDMRSCRNEDLRVINGVAADLLSDRSFRGLDAEENGHSARFTTILRSNRNCTSLPQQSQKAYHYFGILLLEPENTLLAKT